MTSTDHQSDDDFPCCTAHGHAGCVSELRDGEVWITHHPAPTPPADDVREALIDAMIDVEVSGGMVEFGKDDRAEAAYLADAILAAPGIEVRPRGTVTDAEAEVVTRWLKRFAAEGIVTIGGKGGALEAAAEARRA